jgi:transcriptional regulator GlxA family with amidase domain
MNRMRIGFLVFPGFQILDLVAVSVFELANLGRAHQAYDLRLLSEAGGLVDSSSGVQVNACAYQGETLDRMALS